MILSDSTTALARDATADMIFSLSGAKAFHYVINPETHEHAFSILTVQSIWYKCARLQSPHILCQTCQY